MRKDAILMKALSVAAAASLLCACVTGPVVKYADPPPLDSMATRSLKLALVVTPKTREGVKKFHDIKGWTTFGVQDVANRPFEKLVNTVRRSFKSVIVVDTVEQALASDADLIGVLDLETDLFVQRLYHFIACEFTIICLPFVIAGRGPAANKVDLQGKFTFLTLDQTPIETLELHFRRKSLYITDALPKVASDVERGVRNLLAGSEKLGQFAKEHGRRGPRRPAAVAAAPVRMTPASSVDTPLYNSETDADSYALVVGVERYEMLPAADHAERDAKAVRAHLRALGYPDRNIILLTGDEVSRASIAKYVESWLPDNVRKGSRVFVYFSGHGAPDPESRQAYLVPWDGDPQFLANTGYPVKRLYERLGKLKARSVVLAMDACFSGAGGRSVLAKGVRPLVTRLKEVSRAKGRLVVLAAADADEVTGTAAGQSHGLFTYHLLESLNESKGESTVRELFDTLAPKVRDAARRENRSQTPKLIAADPELTGLRLKR